MLAHEILMRHAPVGCNSRSARAVGESETETERLRAHARRALELARAINDPEAALRLEALAATLLERVDALERKDEN
jgi:hypothetical protein